MDKRLIVLDLDNTLLNEYGKVSDYSKMCLKKYEELGHLVVLASQDNYSEMNRIHEDLNLHGPIICQAGGELHYYNPSIEDEVMSIDIPTLKKVFKDQKESIYSAFYHFRNNLYIHNRLSILQPLYGITSQTEIHENNFLDLDLKNPNMIFMVIHVAKSDEFKKYIESYKDYFQLTSLGKDLNYELFYLNIKNVNKMYAVLEIMLKLNYKESQLIAVGDSIKDAPLLKLRGETCAMINGEMEAKECAKYISEFDNTKDGACKFVNKILNINI